MTQYFNEDIRWEDYQPEIENRIRNMMWTVSGDYGLDIKPDVVSFVKSKYISLYDAIKQGGFAKYFDANELGLYIVKKLYYGADEGPLMSMAQLCVDAAVYPLLQKDRPGVVRVRQKAFEAMLEHDYAHMSESFPGRVKISILREFLYQDRTASKRIRTAADAIAELENASETFTVVKTIDKLYNTLIDPTFERKHGDLDHVLAVETEELAEAGWQDFLDEQAQEAGLEQLLEQVNTRVTSLEDAEQQKEEKKNHRKHSGKVVILDEEAIAKMDRYMQLNYGRSYLPDHESKRLNYRLCYGAHADCSLYYTDGILANPVLVNSQYVSAKKQADRNRLLYHNSKNTVLRNIDIMAANLRRSLLLRSEREEIASDHGTVVPKELWRIGRSESGKLFRKTVKENHADFVVDILMDASGSQRDRQPQVAIQAYIIGEALSIVGIPARVMSFCSFWDFTVMQRLREYDAPRSENRNIFNYTTSSNNRDGLAIRAAADSLLAREEENKILIVLSDGRPNDVIVNRPNSRNPKPYVGDYAVMDTALEVRKLRNMGIFVLGVFAGNEKDLQAEKKIFGKDFAYIKDIRNFSNVVSLYLQRLLDW